jgi:hypothetical protein
MPKTFRNTGCSLDVAQTQKHLLYKQRLDIRLFIDDRGRLCTRNFRKKILMILNLSKLEQFTTAFIYILVF